MRILLDHCVPRRLARLIVGHDVTAARRVVREESTNRAMLSAAEMEGFDVLLTVGQYLHDQEGLDGRRISVVALKSAYIDDSSLSPLVPSLHRALEAVEPGSFVAIHFDD